MSPVLTTSRIACTIGEMERRQKAYITAGILGSVLIMIIAVIIASERTSYAGRAQEQRTASLFSRENSYLFASPVSASADGASLIRVTVFLLNDQGLGIPSQEVKLNVTGPVVIRAVQPTTDSFGRSLFDITSSSPGSYTINAEVLGTTVPQTVSVAFH
jgi:hypothetical protein